MSIYGLMSHHLIAARAIATRIGDQGVVHEIDRLILLLRRRHHNHTLGS